MNIKMWGQGQKTWGIPHRTNGSTCDKTINCL